jgi:thiaminase (transcriptional activator TenA)
MSDRHFSDEVIEDNREVWEAMQRHRFVRDIEEDRLDPTVFHRYLAYENAFVETAISIFGHLLVKAPALAEQRRMIGVLKALSEEQIAYFRDAFQEIGLPESAWRDIALPMPVVAFQQSMLAFAAHGPYVEGVAAMFAAEWMYWHWCSKAAVRKISDPVLRRWVDLHAAEGFAAQARWLKQQIDLLGKFLNPAGRRRVSAVFSLALQLEIDFHAAAYSSWTS